MTEQALTALRASIEHWDRLASGKRRPGEEIGPHMCALCKLFNKRYAADLKMASSSLAGCPGCPVEARTGKPFCADTPYEAVEQFIEGDGACQYSEPYDSDEFQELAIAELEFLRSLVPQEKA